MMLRLVLVVLFCVIEFNYANTNAGEFSYQVEIANTGMSCGGSLISSLHILGSSYCLGLVSRKLDLNKLHNDNLKIF